MNEPTCTGLPLFMNLSTGESKYSITSMRKKKASAGMVTAIGRCPRKTAVKTCSLFCTQGYRTRNMKPLEDGDA